MLASVLGLNLSRRDDPNQGVQKEISLFGKPERVGFYNTFSARCGHDYVSLPMGLGMAELSRDPLTDEVHAIQGDNFCGVQFHVESLLTIDGIRIFQEILTRLCHKKLASEIPLSVVQPSIDDSLHGDPLRLIDEPSSHNIAPPPERADLVSSRKITRNIGR